MRTISTTEPNLDLIGGPYISPTGIETKESNALDLSLTVASDGYLPRRIANEIRAKTRPAKTRQCV